MSTGPDIELADVLGLVHAVANQLNECGLQRIPDDYRSWSSAWPRWRQEDGTHWVLFHAANSLGNTGQVTATLTAYIDLAATAHDRLGPDHPAARGNRA